MQRFRRFSVLPALFITSSFLSYHVFAGSAPDSSGSAPTSTGAEWNHRHTFYGEPDQTLSGFGYSVAISGNHAIAGAPDYPDPYTQPRMSLGAVYFFEKTGNVWESKSHMVFSNPDARYGAAVSIDGDLAVVGMPRNYHAGISNAGGVTVLKRVNGNWGTHAGLTYLVPQANHRTNGQFGSSVHIQGNRVIAGHRDAIVNGQIRGRAYVFTGSGTPTWSFSEIPAPANLPVNAAFGASVLLSGDTAFVGAPAAGRVYVFLYSSGTGAWTQIQQIDAPGPEAGADFGAAITRAGAYLFVGIPGSGNAAGKVAVYRFENSAWAAYQTLSALGVTKLFGTSVSASGNYLVAGSPDDNYIPAGQAAVKHGNSYLFKLNGAGTWEFDSKLDIPGRGAGTERAGFSVAMDGNEIVAGRPDAAGNGSVDFFSLEETIPNELPVAGDVIVSGTYITGHTLTGTYNYTDADNDPESGTAFAWFRADDAAGTNAVAIAGADTTFYVLTNSDTGRYLSFRVTPHDGKAAGVPVSGSWYGPVKYRGWDHVGNIANTGIGFSGFGSAVDISGNFAIVGAPFDQEDGELIRNGHAYIYNWDSSAWTFYHKLKSFEEVDMIKESRYGYSVAIQGNRAMVGAPGTRVSSVEAAGALYFYENRHNSKFPQMFFDPTVRATPRTSDYFGSSLHHAGTKIAVGSSTAQVNGIAGAGKVHVYFDPFFQNIPWLPDGTDSLVAQDPEQNAFFGHSVFLLNDSLLLVGAPGKTEHGVAGVGAVYVFRKSGVSPAAWNQEYKITVPESYRNSTSGFGTSIAAAGNHILIGSRNDNQGAGSVYVFAHNGTDWAMLRQIGSPHAETNGHFGWSVSVSGNNLIIGAPDETFINNNEQLAGAGNTYLYTRRGNNWELKAKLLSAIPKASHRFGLATAIDREKVIVGSSRPDSAGHVDFFRVDTMILNNPPVAVNVSVSGGDITGDTLTAVYTYQDEDQDPESGTTFAWYRADDGTGTNAMQIAGADTTVYILQAADSGKYISFRVTPNDGTDAGDEVSGAWVGPVYAPLSVSTREVRVYLGGDGTAVLHPDSVNSGSTGFVQLSLDRDSFSCADLGPVEAKWEEIGDSIIHGIGEVQKLALSTAVAPDGTIYIAYADPGLQEKLTVARYTASGWQNLGGAGFTTGKAHGLSITTDASGTPYVVFGEGSSNTRPRVLRWTGSIWDTLGGAIPGIAWDHKIKWGPDNKPYVCYVDRSGGSTRLSVAYWNGSTWEKLGNYAATISFSDAFTNFDIAADGSVYVVYKKNNFNQFYAAVARWDGSSWSDLGGTAFNGYVLSEGQAETPDIRLVNNNPYVIYRQHTGGSNLKSMVRFWNGTEWQNLGGKNPAFPLTGLEYSLDVASDGTLYALVGLGGQFANRRPVVMKWSGTEWEQFGGQITPNGAESIRMVIAPGGLPVLAFAKWHSDYTKSLSVFRYQQDGKKVTLTAVNHRGDSLTATAAVKVYDTIRPRVFAKQEHTIYLNAQGTAKLTAAALDSATSDNCGVDSIWISRTDFNCSNAGNGTPVWFYAADAGGNTDSAQVAIQVTDTVKPVVRTRIHTAYLNENGGASVTASALNNGSSDNCGIDTIWLSRYSFGCADTGNNQVTVFVRDLSGNTASATAIVDIRDTLRPLANTRNITVYLNEEGEAEISASALNDNSSDNCGVDTIWLDRYAFTCADTGINVVTLHARDLSGNEHTSTAEVTVRDTVAPLIRTRQVTVYLDAQGTVKVSAQQLNDGSSDNCGVDSVWISRTDFDCSDLGTQEVIFHAIDQSGNLSSKAVSLTVSDTIRPVALARDLTLYLDAAGLAYTTPAAADNGSYDNCTVTRSLSRTVFTCAELGLNRETLTITDSSGNYTTIQVLVTVLDTVRPVVVTRNLIVELDREGKASIIASQLDGGSTDNCTQVLYFSADRTSFTCADTGSNQVLLTVTDQKGNSGSAFATVTVRDLQPPVARSRNITAYLGSTGMVFVNAAMINDGSSDNCVISRMDLDKTIFICSDIGRNTVRLVVTDSSGNAASATAEVVILDTIRPVARTKNAVIYLDAAGQAVLSASDVDNGSSDNCSIAGLAVDRTSFNSTHTGANTVIFTVTDQSGNKSTAAATVTVMDTIRPVVRTRPYTLLLGHDGSATLQPEDVNAGSTDNSGIASVSLSRTTFSCDQTGIQNVMLTVTDRSGNIATGNAQVTVADREAPVVRTRNHTVYLNGSGTAVITAADINNGSTDNCAITGYRLDTESFGCGDLGQRTVTLTASDLSGNSTRQTAVVTVMDTIRPAINNLPADITAYVSRGQCQATVPWDAITGSDNCGIVTVQVSHMNGSSFPLGQTTVSVTVRDGSGNIRTGSFRVTVLDTLAPEWSHVPAVFTVDPAAAACGAKVRWQEPVATDNCGSAVITRSHNPGDTFPVGTTEVSYTATDAYNNRSSVSFLVTVRDEVAPVLTDVPAAIVTAAEPGRCDASVRFTMPGASDNCSGVSVSSSHQPGDRFPVGTTTVDVTATDAAGNITRGSFTVTVKDQEAPAVTGKPADITLGICDAEYNYALPTGTDNCGVVTVRQTAGVAPGNVFPAGVTINRFELTDEAGNVTRTAFTVTILAQEQPVLPAQTEYCVNGTVTDIVEGQEGLVWYGSGISGTDRFDPAGAGAGRHTPGYTYTDAQGCTVSGTVTMTVHALPVTPVVERIGATVLRTGSYSSYQWYRDGRLIQGAIQQEYTYTEGGNYQVMVSNSEGCASVSGDFVIGRRGGAVGISEHIIQDKVVVYPNPGDGMFHVLIPSHWKDEVEIEAYTVTGQRILWEKQRLPQDMQLNVDLRGRAAAIYYLHLKSGHYTATEKLRVENR